MKRAVVLVGAVYWMAGGVGPVVAQQAEGGAQEWFSANVAVTSDYAFRGISQTLEEPAIQGGMGLEHRSGLYLGVWGSSVNFGEDLSTGPRAQLEMDVYGGIGRNLWGLVDLDLGVVHYGYPGAAEGRRYDFVEFGLGASREVGPVGAGVSVKYSPDFFAASGRGVHYGGDLKVPVWLVTLTGSVGRQAIKLNEVFGTPDYTEWAVGAAAGWLGFELGGKYLATNLSEDECFGGTDLCRSRVVFSVARGL